MLNLDLEILLAGEAEEDWIKENSDRICTSVQERESSLLHLVEMLGPVLTHTKPQVRSGGLHLLSATLDTLPLTFLTQEELGVLVSFYTDRLRDHHSIIPQTLRGLQCLCKSSNLSRDQLEILLDSLFRELMVQQQVVRDRAVVFNIISHSLYNRFEFAKTLETQITVGFLQAGEGEKDPRNLVNIFNCSSFILDNFNIDHLREDIFESLAVYFPIDFTPPKGLTASVSKEDLILSLRRGITHPGLVEFSVPLFMEKLDSELESAKIDSVESLCELVKRCSEAEGGKADWLKDNGKILELVWNGLKKELLGIRVQAPEQLVFQIRQLLTRVSYFLETDVGGLRTPDVVGGWRMWFGWVWRDLKPHLSAAGTRLIAGAIDILASLAGSGIVQSRDVLNSSLPVLLATWRSAPEDARNQLISSISQLLVASAQTGPGTDISGLDEIVGLYLETGNLTGLAAAAGVLSAQHRTELCASLLDHVKTNKPCGPALVYLAKWDTELVKENLVPRFLELGEQGLSALADIQEAGLLNLSLPRVAERLETYSTSSILEYIDRVANYTFTTTDRINLREDTGSILSSLLSWSSRPTLTNSRSSTSFCTVLQNLASILDEEHVHVLTNIGILNMIQEAHTNTGCLLELEALVSSLNPSVLNKLPEIVDKVFELPASWQLKASLVNKLPHLSSKLEGVENPEGVGQISHALVLNGHPSCSNWMKKLLHLLDDPEKGLPAASCFKYMLSTASWLHPSSSFLFKQRAWSTLHPPLLTSANLPNNINHLTALINLLPEVPRPLLEPVVPALLPLVTKALRQEATALPALSCLVDLIQSSPNLVSSYIHDIVPRCLDLCVPPSPLNTRLKALVCLHSLGSISSTVTVTLASSVTSGLAKPVQDHKRVVRQEAMKARNRWFLVTQP